MWCGLGQRELLSVLPSLVVEQILLVPISGTGPDILRLAIFRDGNFSLMNNWEFVRGSHNQNVVFSLIWQRHIPSRVSFFLWHLLNGFLGTDDALYLRGFHMVFRCLCNGDVEIVKPLFLDCPVVQ